MDKATKYTTTSGIKFTITPTYIERDSNGHRYSTVKEAWKDGLMSDDDRDKFETKVYSVKKASLNMDKAEAVFKKICRK